MEIADVYFITAVAPAFMGIRAKQILTAFPEFPPENIILGNAKNLVQFDIILDDAIHNVLETPATYPVLMRKPWNWKMTGLLSVNQMSEFVSLVRQIIHASQTRTMEIKIHRFWHWYDRPVRKDALTKNYVRRIALSIRKPTAPRKAASIII